MSEDGLDASSVSNGPSDEPHVPLHLLRQAREAMGLHIAALAAALKVPVRKLEALEAGRYEELPDLTFARALASSACRQLKIDPGPILEQIPMGRQPVLGQPGNAINAPFKASFPGASSSQSSWFFRPSVLIATFLLVAALVLLVLPEVVQLPSLGSAPASSTDESGQSIEPVQLGSSIPEEGATDPAGALPPGGEVGAGVGSTPADPLAADTVPDGTTPTPQGAGVAASEAAKPAEAPSNANALLRIAAVGESWVEVTNGAGTVVAQRVLKEGDVIEFSSAPPYKVILGRAEAARVLVRGQTLDVMPYARNSVARFEVK
ncbi:cytoskeleton protein RodZ [Hydrogenophaga palleronii]|uniref:Cytoskeleton protein RodZ n=1 Tax=Hydrogenophaga palleronii TaxID=65655 RepID=A0ABU1WIQ0_9BURK|nr:RodZ domain-containing protein [Hydrogenophaga palleronii]MDR7148847.1 cytoskeleton protein RodZ [Hydrogenophaga palleronii]